jgi:hypothetical protein
MTEAETVPAAITPSGGEPLAVDLLLKQAGEAVAFERERANRAEAGRKAAEAAKRAAADELAALGDRLAIAIAVAVETAVKGERKRIRELADRSGAVCAGDEGTNCWFSALIAEPESEHAAAPDA